MKRIVLALALAAAGAAFAQSVGSTTSSSTGASDAGFSQAQAQVTGGDGGFAQTPSAQQGLTGPTQIYTFDPPPIGQYSFSVTSR